MADAQAKSMKKVIISGMIGNGFEWYDFALYGQMALIIGHLFFPSESAVAQSLAAFAAFAVAFVFRPLGALFFGWVADKYGRKKSLVIAILMMAIPTGAIGVLPTYESIGMWAPILLVLIRILQGLSLGGEFGGAITYIVEHSESEKRGLIGSSTVASLIIGFLCGSFVVWTVKYFMPAAEFAEWGWRIPFLLGVVIGLVGFYIRHQCDESPAFKAAAESNCLTNNPAKDAFVKHWPEMLKAFGIYTAVTMPFYLTAIYFIAYSKTELGLSDAAAFEVNLAAMLSMLVGVMIGAVVSDRVGRKKFMVPVLLTMMLVIFPTMLFMESGNYMSAMMWQSLFGLAVGLYVGPIPAILVEIFPTSVRCTGMSLAFNGATVVFGGTAPFVCVSLMELTGTPISIAFYVCFCCALALLAFHFYRDRWNEKLI